MKSLLRPEFFDIFGVAVFLFITGLSWWAFRTKKAVPRWAIILLFTIGIAGILVDGTIIYFTYLRGLL